MSEFQQFKAAVRLLADCTANATDTEQLTLALISRRDNPFYDIDFWAYAVALQNTIIAGLDDAMGLLGDGGEQ